MKKSPFFSVIIPVFKSLIYIERCIQSCLNQSFQDFEIILIDDCGNDGSIKIAKKYQQKNSKIIILHNPSNLGAFHSRLEGIKYATGKYCIFLDSDDFIVNDALEVIYSATKKKSPDILQYRFSYFPKKFYKPSPYLQNHFIINPKIYQTLNTSSIFQSICDKCIKTKYAQIVSKKLSFIRPPFSCMEDGLFFLILSFEVQSYQSINNILYFYQNNPNSTTQLISNQMFEKKIIDFQNGLQILQMIKKLYPQHIYLIHQYERKAISAYILEGRKYTKKNLVKIFEILKFKKKPIVAMLPFPTYLISCFISIKYFYRWQTLARILLYLFTFGKIKL